MEFSGIYVDNEFNLNFISHYTEVHSQIERAYKETYYKDFFIQEIDCDTDLISIV